MIELTQHRRVGQGHSFLQPGCSRRMLDECQTVGLNVRTNQIFVVRDPSSSCTKQPGSFVERHMAEYLVGKRFVDDHSLGLEIRSYPGQSGAVLGWLDLEVRIGEERGRRAQHHRSDKGRHRRNALRHNDDNAVARGYTLVTKYPSL